VRIALFSDVHGNLAALEAVLGAVAAAAPDRVLCLGDVVGYYPDPAACIARVREAAHATVAGNHDVDTLREEAAPGSSDLARRVQAWTRERLGEADRRWLAGLPARWLDPAGLVAVHGCYLNETHTTGYVTSTMLPKNLAAVAAREGWPRVACCGHTHAPMVGWLDGGGCHEPRPQGTLVWPAAAAAVLINPGAVGQPRDGDPRASWALVDLAARTVEVRRVPYDLERTLAALSRAGLPEALAERLRAGR
jgi:predicted phosphodiesterase